MPTTRTTDPEPSRRVRGRPRDRSIDVAVIGACVALLGEEGRAGLSRARIARRAGVSLPAVNRRYASVDEILVAVASTPPRSSPASPGPGPASLREFLADHVVRLARAFADATVRRAAAELLAAAAGDEGVDAAFREALDETRTAGIAWIERARESGDVGPGVDAETVLDLVDGAAYYRLLWRGEALTEADAGPLVDLVLRGVAG